MKEKKIFDALTNIDDEFIEETRKQISQKKKKKLIRRTALAASVIIVVGAGLIWTTIIGKNDNPKAPQVVQGGGATQSPSKSNAAGKQIMAVKYPKANAFGDTDTSEKYSNSVDASFLKAVNQFAYKTTTDIFAKSSGNINYSPVSLYYALSLASTGANGTTESEMLSLLGADSKEELSMHCKNLYRCLFFDNKIGKLRIGNSLWMNKEIVWKNRFINNAAKNLYTATFSVDFANKNASKLMSDWVSKNTGGTIEPQINPDPNQVLSIINTIYFYDQWSTGFDKELNSKDVFYLANGKTVDCDFMNATYPSGGYVKGNGYVRSDLNLKNNNRMVFILPDANVSARELLSSPKKMQSMFEGGTEDYGKIVWTVPKFKFGSDLKLNNVLQTLGIKSAFEENADFSGITDSPAWISSLHQQTHIGIDENGVEASAFTQINMAGSSMPHDTIEMNLNRPFIYGILSNDNTILFVGVCENPTSHSAQ